MASKILFLLLMVCDIGLSNNVTNSSFNSISQHIRSTHIFPHLSILDDYKMRTIDSQSNQLFVTMHATQPHEIQHWRSLKDLLLNLEVNPDKQDSVIWTLHDQLIQHCSFINISHYAVTTDHIRIIEQLFYIILTNSKLATATIRNAVAELLFEQFDPLLTDLSPSHPLSLILDIFQNEADAESGYEEEYYHYIQHNYIDLKRMFDYAANEYMLTNVTYNRYTKFALRYMEWIIIENAGLPLFPFITLSSTAKTLWNIIRNVEFIENYVFFNLLFAHQFPKKNAIQLIIDVVFVDNEIFVPQQLNLFITVTDLWDLEMVIDAAINTEYYCWSSMRKLLNWILEYKESIDLFEFIFLMINKNILTANDIVCVFGAMEIPSPNDLKKLINTKHQIKIKRCINSNVFDIETSSESETTTSTGQGTRDCDIEFDFVGSSKLSKPKPLFATTKTQKQTNNKHFCCSVM